MANRNDATGIEWANRAAPDGYSRMPAAYPVTDAEWDREKGERWQAFYGDGRSVRLRMEVRPEGAVCTGVFVTSDQPVTATSLRSIALGLLVDAAAENFSNMLLMSEPADSLAGEWQPAPAPKAERRRTHTRWSDDERRAFAAEVRAARISHPGRATKYLAEKLGYSPAQIRRKAAEVEALGLTNQGGTK